MMSVETVFLMAEAEHRRLASGLGQGNLPGLAGTSEL